MSEGRPALFKPSKAVQEWSILEVADPKLFACPIQWAEYMLGMLAAEEESTLWSCTAMRLVHG